ncbi:unnamed protein product [Sphagnum jensenii]|uniref:Uncharacterized protein n=1 Tax=Sphagnum jensenii TaxID=128206 RepID=A0ABP1BRY8_9BRYO
MEESRKVSEEWLMQSNLWEPSRDQMMEEEEEGDEELEEEDLDEYEGVVQALSNLESTTRRRVFQSALNPKHLQSRRFQAESKKNTTRALSDVDAAAGLFVSSASSSSSSWEEEEEEEEEESSTTPATRRRHSRKVPDTIRNRDKQQHKLLEKNRRSTSCSAYATAAVAAAEQEEQEQEQGDHLWQRIEDLEKKVNMLITEEYYFHRISVPRGCFAVVLPGPSYAHRLTEDVIESLQMRIESIWPLCYLAPVVAQLVGFASAMFRRWLPLLPSSSPVVYNTCCCSNFTSSAAASEDLVVHHHHAAVADCHQTSTSTAAYVTKRLEMI